MAKPVYESETIALQDGTEVTLVPLAIGLLRKFHKAFAEGGEIENEADGYDVYINCCGIALSKQVGDKFEKPLNADNTEGWLTEEYRNWLEDVLDQPTIFRIIKI